MFDVKYEKKLNGEKTLSTKDLKELSNLIKKGKRIIISGGLNINNISKIKRIKPYALDVASGVESMVGEKDSQLVSAFVNKVKYEVA